MGAVVGGFLSKFCSRVMLFWCIPRQAATRVQTGRLLTKAQTNRLLINAYVNMQAAEKGAGIYRLLTRA